MCRAVRCGGRAGTPCAAPGRALRRGGYAGGLSCARGIGAFAAGVLAVGGNRRAARDRTAGRRRKGRRGWGGETARSRGPAGAGGEEQGSEQVPQGGRPPPGRRGPRRVLAAPGTVAALAGVVGGVLTSALESTPCAVRTSWKAGRWHWTFAGRRDRARPAIAWAGPSRPHGRGPWIHGPKAARWPRHGPPRDVHPRRLTSQTRVRNGVRGCSESVGPQVFIEARPASQRPRRGRGCH